jgi:hypothetical protein
MLSRSTRPSGDRADVPRNGVSSTLGLIRQGELETVVIGHRTTSVWDYIDRVRATQTRLIRGAVTHYESSEHDRALANGPRNPLILPPKDWQPRYRSRDLGSGPVRAGHLLNRGGPHHDGAL